jgi:toxin-antitoxin system PIN domain toxin
LLDVNVLIALLWPAHEHHEAALAWFAAADRRRWATCPLTQLAFVRITSNAAFSRDALTPAEAITVLDRNLAHPRHVFWPDGIPLCADTLRPLDRLQGHRQVTDAYLLALASTRKGVLATFDAGIESLAGREHRGAAEIVPVR